MSDQRSANESSKESNGSSNFVAPSSKNELQKDAIKFLLIMFGLTLAVGLGYTHSRLMKEMHESDHKFSKITELEREISFRTEAGLYYSYYKDLLRSPDLQTGLHRLQFDNKTESLRTVNIISRFNIFPEIILAGLYKVIGYQTREIYFYMDSVYLLHGAYVAGLFCTAWLMSGSLWGGVLAAITFTTNHQHTTRLRFGVSLRESFAMPFIGLQSLTVMMYLVLGYQRGKLSKAFSLCCVPAMYLFNLLTAMSWQFAQFVFLLEGAGYLAAWVLQLTTSRQLMILFGCKTVAMVTVYWLQFGNAMLLTSYFISLFLAVVLTLPLSGVMSLLKPSRMVATLRLIICCVGPVCLMMGINKALKVVISVDEDDHIYKFVQAKFGLVEQDSLRDFEVLIYLCEPAFMRVGADFFWDVYETTLLQCAVTAAVGMAVITLRKLWSILQNKTALPSLGDPWKSDLRLSSYVILFVQFFLFGVIALSARRFLILFAPYACVLVGATIANNGAWVWLLHHFDIRGKAVPIMKWVTLVTVSCAIIVTGFSDFSSNITNPRRFHDPDTVQLMTWIKENTPLSAAFAGSMQLLAGVKLCTGRTLVNHPHFENKLLRERTVQVYQIYGQTDPKRVHKSLKGMGADYIILEDSICMAYQNPDLPNCLLKDLVDLSNGHLTEGGPEMSDLEPAKWSRFCDAIRYQSSPYKSKFPLLFSNPTFRVHEVI